MRFEEAMKFKKYFMWFIVLVFVILVCRRAVAGHQAVLRQTVVPCGYWEPTCAELRKAMRYHGILFAQEDEKHEWYFMRDGKRCRLFGYLNKVKRLQGRRVKREM